MLLCLCHHDTCHSRSCIRAGGAETGTGQKNSGHTGNVHKTAIRYGTDRGADVSGNEAGTGSGNVQPAEAGGIYTDLLSVWHPSHERGAGFRGERKIFIRERTGGGHFTDSYGNALRAALREDPDIILVGEMRDFDTISTAITAAETGHLVFSTLHTIGAAPTIERIVDVFPPHQQNQIRSQLASVLEAVISQQLLPTIDGKSRVAAFEVMLGTPAIKNLIREDKAHQIPSIMQTSKKIGMQTMDDSLFSLYLKHKIDAANAVEYAQDTGNMQQKLF